MTFLAPLLTPYNSQDIYGLQGTLSASQEVGNVQEH